MARKKGNWLLGAGWAAIILGTLMILDACIRLGPRQMSLAGLEASTGFAVAVVGWLLRRAAVTQAKLNDAQNRK
ncbi:MAG: hypothetical protein NZ739_06210 [Verrucomicrobiae bacterium]|nr:hypothetical protein [Verrucomicrobiae bacterium]MCX7721702.1 hypothetical protein [Verrucomicrobiae bacterium]MDW7981186.1 hypothetical protein [Verrucomicrobiales bacterium]